MIWEQVKAQISFQAQALNVPIEVKQLSENESPQDIPDTIQVVFQKNTDQPVRSSDTQLQVGCSLTEDNQKTITQALEKHLPSLARNYHKKQRDQLKQLVLSGVEVRKRSLKDSIFQSERTQESLNRQVFELTKTHKLDSYILARLEKPHLPLCKKIVNEYNHLRKLVPGLYQSIQFFGDTIKAKTHRVNIYYDDYEYEIGVLSIELNLSTGQAKIYNLTTPANGYPHPHVNDSSEICLGNIGSGLRQHMGEFEIYAALELLHKFVHSYNEEDAYQKVQYWDPYYSDEDSEYERCRDGGSYGRTCLDCGDSMCPFYENALNECIEDMSFENCVSCSDRCEPGNELLQECHDENPLNCMTCRSQSCLFYKDYEGCHSVNEDQCPTCNIEDCHYQGVIDEAVTT